MHTSIELLYFLRKKLSSTTDIPLSLAFIVSSPTWAFLLLFVFSSSRKWIGMWI